VPIPGTKYKPSNSIFFVTSIALICGCVWAQLLHPLAQSLIGSPGTLVGLGISRTNADSQWNPVYIVFHRNFCCANETIRRYVCKRDLDAANLRPALEQGCAKQTLNARKLFSRVNLLHVPNV